MQLESSFMQTNNDRSQIVQVYSECATTDNDIVHVNQTCRIPESTKSINR